MEVFRTRVMSRLELTSVTWSSGPSLACWPGSSPGCFRSQSQGVGVGEGRRAQEPRAVTRRSPGGVPEAGCRGRSGATTAQGEDSPGPQGIRRLWVRAR